MKPRSLLLRSGIVLSLFVAVVPGCAARLPAESGMVAPSVRVRATGGEFDSEARAGQPLVLEFWETGCEYCRALAPRMQRVHERIAARGGTVLGLAMQEDSLDRARTVARSHGMEFPVALAPLELVDAYGVRAVPFLVVIDRGGRVVRFFRGTPDERELDEAIARASR